VVEDRLVEKIVKEAKSRGLSAYSLYDDKQYRMHGCTYLLVHCWEQRRIDRFHVRYVVETYDENGDRCDEQPVSFWNNVFENSQEARKAIKEWSEGNDRETICIRDLFKREQP